MQKGEKMEQAFKEQMARLTELSEIAVKEKEYDGLAKLTSAMVTIAAFVASLRDD